MWNVIKMAALIKVCTTKYENIREEKKCWANKILISFESLFEILGVITFYLLYSTKCRKLSNRYYQYLL